MSDLISQNLPELSRRSWLKLAGVGAGAVGLGLLSGCSQATADTEETVAAEPDPNALAIMSSNENPFGPSPLAMEAMAANVANIYRYAGPLTMEFGQMIAEREGVSPDQVLITNGSTPLLAAFAQWVYMNDLTLLTSAITYEGVPRVSEAYGTEVIYTPLDADMGYDMPAIEAQVGPGKAVYLCNPNNPTGRTIDPVVLDAFVDSVSAQGVPIFVDEAYLDMSEEYPAGVMTKYVEMGRPVVVARTFSKIYAMAGQRIGYAIMPPEMAMAMRSYGHLSNVNTLGLYGAMAAYNDTAYFEDMRAKTKAGRDRLIAMAADLGRPIAPSPQGSFIYMDTGMSNAEFARLMLERGVRVVGNRWTDLPQWTRICVGLDHEIDKCHAAAADILTAI